jgi:hypothetical protein
MWSRSGKYHDITNVNVALSPGARGYETEAAPSVLTTFVKMDEEVDDPPTEPLAANASNNAAASFPVAKLAE